MWKTVANELTHQLLLSDFTNDQTISCQYELDSVRALASDKNETYKRMNMGVAGGWVTIAEARNTAGLDTDETHDVYLRPLNMVAVPQEDGNKPYQITQEQSQAIQEAGIQIEGLDLKATLSTESYPVESDRQPKIVETATEKAPISAKVKKTLQKKVKDHNEKHGDKKGKRVTLRMLSAVFRRGVGAYNTNPQSVRPSVTSSDQWALARVNVFLGAVRTGRFKRGKFDRDLLPEGHPLKTDK